MATDRLKIRKTTSDKDERAIEKIASHFNQERPGCNPIVYRNKVEASIARAILCVKGEFNIAADALIDGDSNFAVIAPHTKEDRRLFRAKMSEMKAVLFDGMRDQPNPKP
jgi:hypothetical protein